MPDPDQPERKRLAESEARIKYWKRWGPYLAERAWGVVREDYSADGDAWDYFTHDHARSRAYRWTEDGILGICDNHQRLCFALAFWNGKDPILKERLFGLAGTEGNHGEDVKEIYYYLEATPTHSYLKGLYKYPQARFPYEQLVEENRRRTRFDPEYEIQDTGVFAGNRYFDIFAEYAKGDVDDIFVRVTIANRGPGAASLLFLPTLWFRNTWSWGDPEEPLSGKPGLHLRAANDIEATHPELGTFHLSLDGTPDVLFTDNETNTARVFGWSGKNPYCKDAFHEYLIDGRQQAVNPQAQGTKACALYRLNVAPVKQAILHFRLYREGSPEIPPGDWDAIFNARIQECTEFYDAYSHELSADARSIQRQAFAGLFWSKQFYHYVVERWLDGDPGQPPPPASRQEGRNHTWRHIYNEDVVSMPDKWEYPWYAAWDLGFHTVAIALADPDYAKAQLSLFLREWYMHPNGQLPAYEWNFSDVNPPVHAWAAWRVFEIDRQLNGREDYEFLERVFHKLLMNFTWWVNRKDSEGANIFEGGFLGLDNIGIFNRNEELPPGWLLEQSDGSSWMAMYSLAMLKIALHLAYRNAAYEDIASKFFEHFLYIAYAINHHDGSGLWDERDGFYYDNLRIAAGQHEFLRIRSLVGIVPLFAAGTLNSRELETHVNFKRRMDWFIEHRKDLTEGLAPMTQHGMEGRRLLSVANRPRLERMLQRLFAEQEFLSPYGIRSLSRYYKEHRYQLTLDGHTLSIGYEPGDSQTAIFGGNSNWRGPVWFPMNWLIIQALLRLDYYYSESFTVEFPTGSGRRLTLAQAAQELSRRLCALFLPDSNGLRPVYGSEKLFQEDPNFRDYALFYEFFDGDTGRGLGASHQTGWTGLVAMMLAESGNDV